MTKTKANTLAKQLKMSLLVHFQNASNSDERDKVKVSCSPVKSVSEELNFLYLVKMPKSTWWDVPKVIEEVKKIVPNTQITQQCVNFNDNYICLLAKELGKRGSYRFGFMQETT